MENRINQFHDVSETLAIVGRFITIIRSKSALILFVSLCISASAWSQSIKDTLSIPEVVVTGTRNAVDVRHLPMSVSVVDHKHIEKRYEPSLLPVLTEQVPGLFTTARGIMGYGVSAGGSGGMSMRGVGGSPTTAMLVLIDGASYFGCLPINDGRKSRDSKRPGIGALWLQCNGWRY